MESASSDCRFYAFISYSRKNEDVAVWFQKKLESYRLPAALQKQNPELPKKLKIFLDQTDIGVGGTVERALSRELEDSKKLIVLCSPDSAKSEYVEYEISSFLKMDRTTDDVFPLVIAGKIDPSSKEHCYTPLLTSLNLNAADAVQEGRSNAFIRLLAGLLGIKYDDLKRREHIRTVRKNVLSGFLGTILLMFAGFFTWYITPHTKCYNDYVTQWGIPVGLGKAKFQLDSTHYEITYQYGRPVKLVHKDVWGCVTSHGSENELQNRPRSAVYTYRHAYMPFMNMKDWKLSQVDCLIDSNTGKNFHEQHMQMVYEWTDENTAVIRFYYDMAKTVPKTLCNDVLSFQNIYYDDIPNLLQGVFIGENEDDMPDIQLLLNSSNIYRHNVVYNERGFETIISFYNYAGQSASDKNGIHGLLRTYRDTGQLVKEEYQYDSSASKHLYKVLDYDDRNEMYQISFYEKTETSSDDSGPVLIVNKARNYARMVKKHDFDENGEKSECTLSYFDESLEPIYATENEVKAITSAVDNQNHVITQTVYTKDSEIVYVAQYEKKGKVLFETVKQYLDGEISGVYNYEYDSQGNEVYYSYGTLDELQGDCIIEYASTEDGGSSIKYSFDEDTTRTYIYDRYGRHIEDSYNIEDTEIAVKLVYDGFNKHIYCYLDGEPCSDFAGFAQADFSYHSTGVMQNVVYRDEFGKRVNHWHFFTFAEYNAIVTPHGLIRHEEFKDEKGNIVTSEYHKYAVFDGDSGSKDLFLTEGRYLLADGSCAEEAGLWFEEDKFPYEKSVSEKIGTAIRYYDSKGKTQQWKLYDVNGVEKYRCYYKYLLNDDFEIQIKDSLGRFVRIEYRAKDGSLKNKEKSDYAVVNYTYSDSDQDSIEFINQYGFVTASIKVQK